MPKPIQKTASIGALTVNLKALAANWELLGERMRHVNPKSICAAVVKADAYGLGACQVSQTLWSKGCRVFFVATLPEGIELREALGDQATIVVFGGLAYGLGYEWLQYSLVPMLFDSSHIDKWQDYNRTLKAKLPYVIKIDTGMHRLGLSPTEYKNACLQIKKEKWFEPWLVMSHLACADISNHSLNQAQLQVFTDLVTLSKQHFSETQYSLANSSGLFLGDPFIFDMARPGVALYGANPVPGEENPMHSVVSLQLPIMQVKTIAAGEGVGYGVDFIAKKTTRIAIVFGGYADGLFRALSNSGFAFCSGVKVPLIGRVSMDSMIFDISAIQDDIPSQVDILGQCQSIDELAGHADTIAYEILTSLGHRYKRSYIAVDE